MERAYATLPTSWPAWARVVGHRWTEVVRHRAVTAVLSVVAALAVVAGLYAGHPDWGARAGAGLVLLWAALAVPIAAYGAWRDERLARIAAESLASRKPSTTLRAAMFELARDLRSWLRSLDGLSPAEEEWAIQNGFEGDYRPRVSELWERLRIASFPRAHMPLKMYLPKVDRDSIAVLADDLDIFASGVAPDFLAQ
jgi:hypothetical protein